MTKTLKAAVAQLAPFFLDREKTVEKGINSIIATVVRHYAFEARAFVLSATSMLTEEALSSLPREVAGKLLAGKVRSSPPEPTPPERRGPWATRRSCSSRPTPC